MAFHDVLPLGDLGNGGSMLLNLLVLVEVRSEGGTDEDVDLVLRLEAGGHLLVDNFLRNGRWGGVGVLGEELLGALNGKGWIFRCEEGRGSCISKGARVNYEHRLWGFALTHGISIINMLSRAIVLVATQVITFPPRVSILQIRFILLGLLLL